MSNDASSVGPSGKAPKWQLAFAQLLEGMYYAQDLKRPTWQFAVEIASLHAAGLTTNDLRWIGAKGYIEHMLEIGPTGLRPRRRFRSRGSSSFGRRSCLVLTQAGIAFAEQLCRTRLPGLSRFGLGALGLEQSGTVPFSQRRSKTRSSKTPYWDPASRMLWFGSSLIKRFNVPAANQELILAAFQEEGWPSFIDDPLPPITGINSKQRLHDAIKRLNGCHKRHLIRFTGNGDGLAIGWKRVPRRPRSAPDRP